MCDGSFEVRVGDGTLRGIRLGKGRPLVAIHGGLGLDHTYLRPGLEPLASDHDLVLYDQRGNGRSSEPGSWHTVSTASLADDAAALIESLQLRTPLVLGHSFGACVALELAVRQQGLVSGLILVGGFPAFDYGPAALAALEERAPPEVVREVKETLSNPASSDAEVERYWQRALPAYFHELRPQWAEQTLGEVRFRAAAHNQCLTRYLPAFDVRAQLPELRIPALVVTGEHDWVAPPAQGAHRLARIAESRVEVIPECGHFPFIEQRHLFTALVRAWSREKGLT